MRTAIQQVFSDLEEMHPNLFNVYTTEGKEFINHFHKYLAVEKEQIIKAYEYTAIGTSNYGEQYYNKTYKPETNETL